MTFSVKDRALAFAAICQAAALVQQIANRGECNQEALKTTLESILVTDPKTVEDASGKPQDLVLGLQTMTTGLGNSRNITDIMRYIIGLITLESKLIANNETWSQLGNRLNQSKNLKLQHQIDSDEYIERFAEIYVDLISPLSANIKVTGLPTYLKQPLIQKQIRAILLAGIRAAVLWRQVGGSRIKLIFGRNKLIEQASILLARS